MNRTTPTCRQLHPSGVMPVSPIAVTVGAIGSRTRGMDMGCLFALFAGLFPRLALFILWVARPARIDAAFDTFLLPLLGIVFLPFATLIYVLLYTRVAGHRMGLVLGRDRGTAGHRALGGGCQPARPAAGQAPLSGVTGHLWPSGSRRRPGDARGDEHRGCSQAEQAGEGR